MFDLKVSLQRCNPVAHHVATDGEFVVLHQRLETFHPILPQSLLERFEGFRNISVRTVDQPVQLFLSAVYDHVCALKAP